MKIYTLFTLAHVFSKSYSFLNPEFTEILGDFLILHENLQKEIEIASGCRNRELNSCLVRVSVRQLL